MHNKSIKILLLLLSVVLMTAVFAGCGAAALERPETLADVQIYEVEGKCEISLNNGVVNVSGETTLISGALIRVSVHAQSGEELDSIDIVKSGDTDEISHDFVMTEEYDDATYIVGYITCAPKIYGEQEQKVYDAYGEEFQYVKTAEENIWNRNGIVVMFASDPLVLE